MLNLSQIFPSGYLNIPSDEELEYEVQDLLCECCSDKQIMDKLKAIKCPYMRQAISLKLQHYWHELEQLRDDIAGYYDTDGNWRQSWVYIDSDIKRVIKYAIHEQLQMTLENATSPYSLEHDRNASYRLEESQIEKTKDMKTEKPIQQIKMENCNVIMGDSLGGIFALPGSQPVIHQYADRREVKAESREAKGEEGVETIDERTKRKEAAMKDMCRRLDNLETSMLGQDNQGKRITYEQLAYFFKRALGTAQRGSKQEFLTVQEGIWTILIDKRDKCHKDPSELFYSQTFLNIIGYLRKQNIINGKVQDILDCLYTKPEESMRKCLERGIVSAFPDGTEELLDFYINLLKQANII